MYSNSNWQTPVDYLDSCIGIVLQTSCQECSTQAEIPTLQERSETRGGAIVPRVYLETSGLETSLSCMWTCQRTAQPGFTNMLWYYTTDPSHITPFRGTWLDNTSRGASNFILTWNWRPLYMYLRCHCEAGFGAGSTKSDVRSLFHNGWHWDNQERNNMKGG